MDYPINTFWIFIFFSQTKDILFYKKEYSEKLIFGHFSV